jgi:hypothetical protein
MWPHGWKVESVSAQFAQFKRTVSDVVGLAIETVPHEPSTVVAGRAAQGLAQRHGHY